MTNVKISKHHEKQLEVYFIMIREAEPYDQERIQYLYELLCPDEIMINVLSERITQIRMDENNFLYIYEDRGNVIGTVFLTICLNPMYGNQPYGVIENVIVDNALRGTGVGYKLMQHVEKVCETHNCMKIMLMSSAYREEAHRFFDRLGYKGNVAKGFKKYLVEPK